MRDSHKRTTPGRWWFTRQTRRGQRLPTSRRSHHRSTVTRLPLRSAAPAPPHPDIPTPQPSPTPTRAAPTHPDRPDPPRFPAPHPPTGQTLKAALGSAPPPDPHPRCACRPRRLPHARPRRSNHRAQDVLGRLTLVGDVNASPPARAPHTCTTKEKDAAPPAALRVAPEMKPGCRPQKKEKRKISFPSVHSADHLMYPQSPKGQTKGISTVRAGRLVSPLHSPLWTLR